MSLIYDQSNAVHDTTMDKNTVDFRSKNVSGEKLFHFL